MTTIDMRDGWNPAAAWFALSLLVEEQGKEGERIREMDDIEAAKRWMEQEGER